MNTNGEYTTDLFVRRSSTSNDPLDLPGGNADIDKTDVLFNKCPTHDKRAYSILVHEAGHALGIRFGLNIHPTVHDSIMAYSLDANRPDCSPHPLDIMAVYALYQGG